MKRYPLSQLRKGDVIKSPNNLGFTFKITSVIGKTLLYQYINEDNDNEYPIDASQFEDGMFQYAPGREPANPPPVPNESRPVVEYVIDIFRQRDEMGKAKYGTSLQVGNTRRSLQDAIEECADQFMYLVTEKLEREAKEAKWKAEIAKYRDALQNLIAVQNGPPLIRNKAEWEAAMGAAVELLGKKLEL